MGEHASIMVEGWHKIWAAFAMALFIATFIKWIKSVLAFSKALSQKKRNVRCKIFSDVIFIDLGTLLFNEMVSIVFIQQVELSKLYGRSFVAKLSWKKNFFEKIFVFYKIYIICRKKCSYLEKKFYNEKNIWLKKTFLHRKI